MQGRATTIASTAALVLIVFGAGVLSSAPAQIVVAAVEVDRVAGSGAILTRLLPTTVYRNGQYHEAAVTGDDARMVQGLADLSSLNRVRDFAIYARGERVGSMRIDRLAPWQVACTWALAGFGSISWRRPPDFRTAEPRVLFPANQEVRRLTLYATSPTLPTQSFFARRVAITEKERGALLAVGKSLLKQAANRKYEFVERVVPRGDILLRRVIPVDVNRDGRVEFVAEFEAPLVQPQVQADSKPALRMLVVTSLSKDASASVLLHLATVFGYGDLSETYSLETVLDINGDAVGELLLLHSFYEAEGFEIFALRAGRFVRVFAGQKWGC